MSQLSINNISVTYGSPVLRNLTLEVRSGEILAIMGRSGSGKTTLLKTLNALMPIESGSIHLDGQLVIDAEGPNFEEWEIRRHLGLVLQDYSLFPHMTVGKNIAIGLLTQNSERREGIERKVRKIVVDLGLTNDSSVEIFLKRFPDQLSGGERQRVQLARTLILNPRVLLLDEITSQVDPQTTQEIISTLRKLRADRAEHPLTMIIVTHLLDFAESFADRIAFLHEGKIVEQGPAASFRQGAKQPETRDFLNEEVVR